MDLLYKDAKDDTYASSIASTWIWAPALFVSSYMAYANGIYGFLWFFLPNVLTLVLFGYLTQKYVPEEGFTVGSLFEDNKPQKMLHSIVSVILLICSTCVQFIALDMIVNMFLTMNIYISTIIIGLFCFIYIFYGGIKICIQSDVLKYIVLLLSSCLLVLAINVFLFSDFLTCIIEHNINNLGTIKWFGIKNVNFVNISLSFGITTAIGLFSAPYVDNTFWQRVYSMQKKKRFKIHLKSAIYFAMIPLMFGYLGFTATINNQSLDWNITKLFNHSIFLQIIFLIASLSTLIATIDSNMCALNALMVKDFKINNEIFPVPLFLIILPILIIYIFHPSIVDMFLVYGTIRTAIAIPTILVMFKHYEEKRLFYATLIAVLIGGIGYIYSTIVNNGYSWMFTVFALLFPLFGIKLFEYPDISEKNILIL